MRRLGSPPDPNLRRQLDWRYLSSWIALFERRVLYQCFFLSLERGEQGKVFLFLEPGGWPRLGMGGVVLFICTGLREETGIEK